MPFDNVRLALDRSVRSYDQDGRLHVAVSHLTKACVNGYRGHEIPGYEQLGLDPNRIYKLLRDPRELQRAVPTYNNIQILDQHIPVTAADDQRGRVVGSTGTDAAWRAPYVDNSLVFWSDPAIAMIESGEMRELSAGYRYKPVMQPGVFQGEAYDGVMTDILANHIALVESGRAGSDVVVMDSKLKEVNMKTAPLSLRAAWMAGSATAYIAPFLAKDQKMPDMAKIFAPVTNKKSWDTKRSEIEAALTRAVKPVLAKDAEVHIHEHLDGASAGAPDDPLAAPGDPGADPGGAAAAIPGAGAAADPTADPGADPNAGADPAAADPAAVATKVQGLLQGQIDDNTLAIIMNALKKPAAPEPKKPDASGGGGGENGGGADNADCATDEEGVAEKLPGLANKDTPAMDKAPVTKLAMDTAIAKAIADTTARLNAREEATKFVRPWVGEMAVAMDSAFEVYKFALEQMGEDVKDIHPSAYKALLSKIPKPGEQLQSRQSYAMDKAGNDDYLKRFPNANRLLQAR